MGKSASAVGPTILPVAAAAALAQAKQALRQSDAVAAERHLLAALALAPRHAEILRLLGAAQGLQGRHADAVQSLQQAIALQPDDPLAHNSLGNALGNLGDKAGAALAFARACELAPDLAPAWHNYAKALCEDLRNEEALLVLQRALQLAPDNRRARFLQAQTLRVTGRMREAIEAYRQILGQDPRSGEAWLGLSNLRNASFDAADVAAMERAAGAELNADDQMSIRFALARGYEDIGRYADAWRTYVDGNARVRGWYPWSAAQFSGRVDEFLAAFTPPPPVAPNRQGSEVVFIVSLPRAGSSLTEQILASHSQVDGAGELADLPAVLHEESQRRGRLFPAWVKDATPADWQRLGARYLERTARWRRERSRFSDKLPDNWRHVGAALAMLPAAHIVICRRDPLETALACFRQLFSGGGQAFSYELADIAAYSRDFERAARHWQTSHPAQVRSQSYEALIDDTENEVRRLLAFCDLEFDERCLRFYETERTVRTASAAQVREPLRRDTARALKYGALLDPLRAALGLPAFESLGRS
jgi:Flp pilus assembly protein TadD